MRQQASLDEAVAVAWCAFGRAGALPSRVSPAVPILFFGDLDAYRASPLRVLTVGLNPSLREFPEDAPFRRFPLAEGVTVGEPDRYLEALSAYFRTDPYRGWFSAFEPLLNGLGSSYYAGQDSTALHTDICSPVATDPTWTGLDERARAALEADGGPLWHTLLEALRPHVVALSVAKHHLSRIEFEALTEWETIHVFDRTGSGEPRKQPIEVSARWYEVGGELSLFVFCPAAQKPLGRLGGAQKREAGAMALEYGDVTSKRRFIQFRHPGAEHQPDPGGGNAWNTYASDHARKFMQLRGSWIAEDGSKQSGKLWAWGEWEPESEARELRQPGDASGFPRWIWHPHYVRKDDYRELHNTDPFIFGERFLYSNCRQPRNPGSPFEGLKHLGSGSVVAFGSVANYEWVLDTVLVVADFVDYHAASMRADVGDRVPRDFMDVTGDPIIRNEDADLPLRLYTGATHENPVKGMFSFFPAMPAGSDVGFPRPSISLPSKRFTKNVQSAKGHAMGPPNVSFEELRGLWDCLVAQVREAGLVLGTHAELPERREA